MTIDPHVNKPAFSVTSDADMRKARVEIIGNKVDSEAFIALVTDLYTDKTDGSVTVGGDIIITGEKIKIFPTDDKKLGVFFVDADGKKFPLDYPLMDNSPKRVICRLPASIVADSRYTLKIVTRFASSIMPLKNSRTIEYELPLTAVKPLQNE